MKRLSLAIALVTSLAFIEGAFGQVTQAPSSLSPGAKDGDWTVLSRLAPFATRRAA